MLKSLAEAMKAEGDAKFEIVGHTDADGEVDANQLLSQQRAMAVLAVLKDDFGIPETKLTASGKGETEPVADNNTLQGKANNRRVEIRKL